MIPCCNIEILNRSDSFSILNIGIALFVDSIKLKVSAVNISAAISRSIVDDDRFVVGVVLGEDRVQTILYSKFSVVVVSGGYHTHREFRSYFRKLKFLFYSIPVFFKVCLS